MKVVQCSNGHYYNQEISPYCPVCGKRPADEISDKLQESEKKQVSAKKTFSAEAGFPEKNSEDVTVSIFNNENDDSRTVMLTEDGKNWSPVVGWLVCVEGSSRGKDYRIHSQRNFIGRSGDMDISISGDDKIALRCHCSIVYEPLKKEFMLVPGEETFTYYNGKPIEKYVKLSSMDKFTIGNTTFAFVPYCKEGVCW